MLWKEQLVDSSKRAFDFLDLQLHAAELPAFTLKNLGEDMTDSIAPYAFVPAPVEDDWEEILYFDVVNRDGGGCLIDGFSVGEPFRGKGLGAIGMKALLGIACELSAQFIELNQVDLNGPSFWPYMGAASPAEPQRIVDDIHDVSGDPAMGLTPQDREEFENVRRVAVCNPYAGWRVLSQIKNLSHQGNEARHTIFSRICHGQSLLIIPGEPSTRRILEERLGILPPFRPLNDDHDYAHIQRALSRRVAGYDYLNP